MVLDHAESNNAHLAQPSSLEALLAGQMNFPAMLDIPPDADDETMVELAIALSLQDQVFDIVSALFYPSQICLHCALSCVGGFLF